MGEIADALRRAGARSATPPRPAAAAAESPAATLADAAAPPAAWTGAATSLPAIGERVVEQLRPADDAVVFGEGPGVEACRRIAVRLLAQLGARDAHSVAIVSAGRDEGKTTVACNLALALASLSPGRKVALVDLDMRNPSVASALGLRDQPGIDDVLLGSAELADAQLSIRDPELDVYPVRNAQQRSHELFVRERFSEVMATLERRYATVVIDTPPVLLVPDSSLILQHVPCCVPIARVGRTREKSLRAMKQSLPLGHLLDGVLNGGRTPGQYDYYGYGPDEGSRRRRRNR